MTSLEIRYRRLLRVYPAGHRADYEDEMVGVLMSGAEPGRRFPAPADAIDLLRAGLTARLGQAFHTQRGTGWRDAAAVTGLFATLVMTGVAVSRLVDGLVVWGYGDPMRMRGVEGLMLLEPALRTATWLLLLVAVVLGLRRTAVAIAAAGVLVQTGAVVWWAGPAPWQALRLAWALALAVVVLALFAVAASGRPARAVLGGRGLALVAAAVSVAAVFWALAWAGVLMVVPFDLRLLRFLPFALVLAAAAVATGPRIRGRIAVLSAVVVAIPVAFSQLEEQAHWAMFFDLTPGIVTTAVIVLLLTPVTVFATAVTLLWAGESLVRPGRGHVRAHE